MPTARVTSSARPFIRRNLRRGLAARAASGKVVFAADGLSVLQNAVALDVNESVKEYYGKTLSSSSDLKTSACTTPSRPSSRLREVLKDVPDEVKAKYYGCGSPTPLGIDGLRVLDLGSGSGRDCYVAAALVGESGSVTGVDMTVEQLEVARKHAAEYCTSTLRYKEPNMRFVEGYIEDLASAGVEDDSVDLIVSNCVINLSTDKSAVLSEAYRVLSNGGELYFSDVYCDRRLSDEARSHEILYGECLGGALYLEDFKRLCMSTGFTDPRVVEGHEIEVQDEELKAVVGEAKFYSITYRLFKLPPGRLETLCEDYGQVAVYKGTIEGHPHAYSLDDHHRFEKAKPMLVCGNTASMVGESWLAPHFEVSGDRSTHFGLFDCSPAPVTAAPAPAATGGGGSCC
mmetsp:Transcript_19752/g.64214  ORF Transcript_19752/g.64214 Transcript_19752/m.64214 type:complete len:401 (+) Transcript_19752:26-1228(+)